MLYSQAPLYYNTTMLAGKRKKESIGEVNYRTGDERLVKLTDSAAEKVNALLQRQGRPEGVLRVAVTGGGCSGLQYKMDLQDTPANRDILVESQGIRVVVDPKSALYVTGSPGRVRHEPGNRKDHCNQWDDFLVHKSTPFTFYPTCACWNPRPRCWYLCGS